MSDRVLVPLPDGRWLALSREAFEAALAEGATAMSATAAPPDPIEPLLEAEQLAKALNLPATAIERLAREERIPFIECGRWRRFRRSAVEAALARRETTAASAA